jgi:hypothetical protein
MLFFDLLHGKAGKYYLDKQTQETSTFPWIPIIAERKYACWSQTKLETAFQIPL